MSWIPRLLLSLAFYAFFLFGWEARLNWGRYARADTALPVLLVDPLGVSPLSPGSPPKESLSLGLPKEVSLRMSVIQPHWPADLWLGKAPRVRLIGVEVPEAGSSETRELSWGGGKDPLYDLLEILGPSARWLFPRLEATTHRLEIPSQWLKAPTKGRRILSLEMPRGKPSLVEDSHRNSDP